MKVISSLGVRSLCPPTKAITLTLIENLVSLCNFIKLNIFDQTVYTKLFLLKSRKGSMEDLLDILSKQFDPTRHQTQRWHFNLTGTNANKLWNACVLPKSKVTLRWVRNKSTFYTHWAWFYKIEIKDKNKNHFLKLSFLVIFKNIHTILEFENRPWNSEFGTFKLDLTLFLLWPLAGLPNPGLFNRQLQVSTLYFSTPDHYGIEKFIVETSGLEKYGDEMSRL